MQSKKTKSGESLLSTVKPSKAIVALAIPATLALLAKAVYNIVDTAYIGMLHDDIVLTAVGVTVPLLLIMVSVENIFAAGAAVLAGRQLDSKDRRGCQQRGQPIHLPLTGSAGFANNIYSFSYETKLASGIRSCSCLSESAAFSFP